MSFSVQCAKVLKILFSGRGILILAEFGPIGTYPFRHTVVYTLGYEFLIKSILGHCVILTKLQV